jgi:hypothetical protein
METSELERSAEWSGREGQVGEACGEDMSEEGEEASAGSVERVKGGVRAERKASGEPSERRALLSNSPL